MRTARGSVGVAAGGTARAAQAEMITIGQHRQAQTGHDFDLRQVPGQTGSGYIVGGLDLERLTDAAERPAAEPPGQPLQPQEHLAVMNASPLAVWRSCGMTPNIAQSPSSVNCRIGGRPANAPSRSRCSVRSIVSRLRFSERDAPVTLERRVERRDVVADVVPDDDAVPEIVEELLERHGLVHACAGSDLVSRHGRSRLRCCVDLDQRVERVLDDDFARRCTATAPMVMRRSTRGFSPVVSESSTTKRTAIDRRVVAPTSRRSTLRYRSTNGGSVTDDQSIRDRR